MKWKPGAEQPRRQTHVLVNTKGTWSILFHLCIHSAVCACRRSCGKTMMATSGPTCRILLTILRRLCSKPCWVNGGTFMATRWAYASSSSGSLTAASNWCNKYVRTVFVGNKLANSTSLRGETHAICKASGLSPKLAPWWWTSGVLLPSAHRQWVSNPGGGGTVDTGMCCGSRGGCSGAGGTTFCLDSSVKV